MKLQVFFLVASFYLSSLRGRGTMALRWDDSCRTIRLVRGLLLWPILRAGTSTLMREQSAHQHRSDWTRLRLLQRRWEHDVESIDRKSNSGECGEHGGDWVNGHVESAQYFADSDTFGFRSSDSDNRYQNEIVVVLRRWQSRDRSKVTSQSKTDSHKSAYGM
jgi:hypothetical protein